MAEPERGPEPVVLVRSLVALAEVASVPRSIAFYARLGFTVRNTFTPPSEGEPTWASLHSERAELMIARAKAPPSGGEHSVLFYLYCDDVREARAALERAGVACGEIAFPFYAPRGEFEIRDPDGYLLVITHT